jgi:hypothetical protein
VRLLFGRQHLDGAEAHTKTAKRAVRVFHVALIV